MKVLLILVLLAMPVLVSASYCSSCSECTSQIQSQPAGSIVYLTSDLKSDATCIDFAAAKGISFDCQGRTIAGPYAGDVKKAPPYVFGILFGNQNSINSGSANCVVRNCVIRNFYDGMQLNYGSGHTIENVQLVNNFQNGINLYYSSSNTVVGCTSQNPGVGRGISLYNSENNVVRSCILNNNLIAFGLTYSTANQLLDSQLIGNGYGISLSYRSNSNTISRNTVQGSVYNGISLHHDMRPGRTDYCVGNIIYNNVFKNPLNFLSTHEENRNTWFTQPSCSLRNAALGPMIAGNFWGSPSGNGFSDTCTDSDRNGICDSGLTLSSGNVDSYPLSNSLDNVLPTAPAGLAVTVVSSSRIDLSWNPSTDNSCLAGYRIYRDGSAVGTSQTTAYSDMGISGAHTYNVAAYDLSGNLGPLSGAAATQAGGADTAPPTTVLNPYSPDPTNVNVIKYVGSVSDASSVISQVQYRFDGGSWNAASPSDGSFDSKTEVFTFTSALLSDGLHVFEVRSQDSSGNMQTVFSWDSLRIDTQQPNTVLNPYSPDPTYVLYPAYSGYATDSASNIVAVHYRVDSGPWNFAGPSDGGFNSLNEAFMFTTMNLSYGTHTVETRALDAAGNFEISYASDTLDIIPYPIKCIAGDANCDGTVDIFDLVFVAVNYNKPDFDTRADLDGNSVVNIFDLVLVAINYGKTG